MMVEYEKIEARPVRVTDQDGHPSIYHVDGYMFGSSHVFVAQFGSKWFIFDALTGKHVGDGQERRNEAVVMFQTVWFFDYMRFKKSALYKKLVHDFEIMKQKEEKQT